MNPICLVLLILLILCSHVSWVETTLIDLDAVLQPFDGIHFLRKRQDNPKIVDLSVPSEPDLTQVPQYYLSNRSQFDARKLEYVLSNEPRSVVVFRDTNTVLIPHRDLLDMLQQKLEAYLGNNGPMMYEEVDVNACLRVQIASTLIPATPCLTRQTTMGEALLSFAYSVSIEYTNQGDLGLGAVAGRLNFTWAFSLTKRLKVGRTVSFSGHHSCDIKESRAVRLFYSPGTIEVSPRTRRIRYGFLDRVVEQGDWRDGERIRYLTETVPVYYCATDRYMDLRCHESVHEYYEEVADNGAKFGFRNDIRVDSSYNLE